MAIAASSTSTFTREDSKDLPCGRAPEVFSVGASYGGDAMAYRLVDGACTRAPVSKDARVVIRVDPARFARVQRTTTAVGAGLEVTRYVGDDGYRAVGDLRNTARDEACSGRESAGAYRCAPATQTSTANVGFFTDPSCQSPVVQLSQACAPRTAFFPGCGGPGRYFDVGGTITTPTFVRASDGACTSSDFTHAAWRKADRELDASTFPVLRRGRVGANPRIRRLFDLDADGAPIRARAFYDEELGFECIDGLGVCRPRDVRYSWASRWFADAACSQPLFHPGAGECATEPKVEAGTLVSVAVANELRRITAKVTTTTAYRMDGECKAATPDVELYTAGPPLGALAKLRRDLQ
ncbi:MAG: hypothetical protein JNL38_40510 [Myxococcales bacterium]|nr:hypothetical protein [Myxococcales bacterium]